MAFPWTLEQIPRLVAMKTHAHEPIGNAQRKPSSKEGPRKWFSALTQDIELHLYVRNKCFTAG